MAAWLAFPSRFLGFPWIPLRGIAMPQYLRCPSHNAWQTVFFVTLNTLDIFRSKGLAMQLDIAKMAPSLNTSKPQKWRFSLDFGRARLFASWWGRRNGWVWHPSPPETKVNALVALQFRHRAIGSLRLTIIQYSCCWFYCRFIQKNTFWCVLPVLFHLKDGYVDWMGVPLAKWSVPIPNY